jgi:hypothetical protein
MRTVKFNDVDRIGSHPGGAGDCRTSSLMVFGVLFLKLYLLQTFRLAISIAYTGAVVTGTVITPFFP